MVRAADDSRLVPTLDRRALLRIGGLSAAGVTLLTACGVGVGGGEEGTAVTTTTTEPPPSDITIVQAATTLEAVAIEVYDRIIAAGVLSAPAADAAEAFKAHHTEHQSLFAGETSKLDAEVATGTHSTLQSRVEQQLAGIGSEPDALQLALDVERALAATYQADTAAVTNTRLRVPIMSVGGVEARHASFIAAILGQPPYPADGFQTTETAVPT